jgi:ABC-type dipeptide/oligopeptide/nickel transport system permease component
VPVSQQLATNLPPTLLLARWASSPPSSHHRAGSAVERDGHSRLRSALQSLPSLFISVPVFWLGIMLIQIFLPARPGLGDQSRPRRAADPAGGDAGHPISRRWHRS